MHLVFPLCMLEAGSLGSDNRVLGHERADPGRWEELYKWGQDSESGPVPAVTTAEHTAPPRPIPASCGISPAVPLVFRLTYGMVFCIYLDRRPKIGVKAVSMSFTSTSPASGDLGTGIGGLRLVWDFMGLTQELSKLSVALWSLPGL